MNVAFSMMQNYYGDGLPNEQYGRKLPRRINSFDYEKDYVVVFEDDGDQDNDDLRKLLIDKARRDPRLESRICYISSYVNPRKQAQHARWLFNYFGVGKIRVFAGPGVDQNTTDEEFLKMYPNVPSFFGRPSVTADQVRRGEKPPGSLLFGNSGNTNIGFRHVYGDDYNPEECCVAGYSEFVHFVGELENNTLRMCFAGPVPDLAEPEFIGKIKFGMVLGGIRERPDPRMSALGFNVGANLVSTQRLLKHFHAENQLVAFPTGFSDIISGTTELWHALNKHIPTFGNKYNQAHLMNSKAWQMFMFQKDPILKTENDPKKIKEFVGNKPIAMDNTGMHFFLHFNFPDDEPNLSTLYEAWGTSFTIVPNCGSYMEGLKDAQGNYLIYPADYYNSYINKIGEGNMAVMTPVEGIDYQLLGNLVSLTPYLLSKSEMEKILKELPVEQSKPLFSLLM